jgi:glutamate formiminotransferase / 5-formyltetrahydrofolate cyclo-ligase
LAGLLQCSPNFSEGRRLEVIEALAAAIESVSAVRIAAVTADRQDNRTVITFAGPPGAVSSAALKAAGAAARLIDLTAHRGDHVRMGATDVIPFVPLGGLTLEEAAEVARRTGEAIARNLAIPVFLYEAAAVRPDRNSLQSVRLGQFEALAGVELDPDCGPARVHPTAGATAVGARLPNVTLVVRVTPVDGSAVADLTAALSAPSVRLTASDENGTLRATISYTEEPVGAFFDRLCAEAERRGLAVRSCELLGLVPAEALAGIAQHYLRLHEFGFEQVLESRLLGG